MVRISVLLPTHNRADVIGYSIESIRRQTFSDFELLIVGDGCTDTTEQVVKKFMQNDARIQWFPFAKGKGFGYTHRNTVLKQARGKLIAFAAHDDIWFPDHLERMNSFFSANPLYDIAYSRPLWVHPTGEVLPSFFDIRNEYVRDSFMHVYNGIPAQCIVHIQKSFDRVGYWNDSLPHAADWDMWKRIGVSKNKLRMGFIPEPTTAHFRANWRSDNTSHETLLKNCLYSILGDSLKTTKLHPSSRKPLQSLFSEAVSNKKWVSSVMKSAQHIEQSGKLSELALLEQNMVLKKTITQYQEVVRSMQNSRSQKVVKAVKKLFTFPSSLRK